MMSPLQHRSIVLLLLLRLVHAGDFDVTLQYLQSYGYFGNDINVTQLRSISINDTVFQEALIKFKEYAGIPVSTNIDQETLERIRAPRCGMMDIEFKVHKAWPLRHIAWHWHYSPRVTPQVKIITQKAFDVWGQHADLTFSEATTNYQILLSFASGSHKLKRSNEMCGYGLDGPGGVLAHAFYPDGTTRHISEIHLDANENWSTTSHTMDNETSLFSVLVHEIGHTLGLDHSDIQDSTMFPWYYGKGYENYTLSQDDIFAIQHLYGVKPASTTTVQTVPTTITIPTTKAMIEPTVHGDGETGPGNINEFTICKLNDMLQRGVLPRMPQFTIIDTQLYVIYAQTAWVRDLTRPYGEYDESPKSLKAWLLSVKLPIIAAYQRPDRDIVVTTNKSLNIISIHNFDKRYEVSYKNINPGITFINGIVNSNRGITYIFYNNYYYSELSECDLRSLKIGSIMELLPGAPVGFQSVYRYNGYLYFVKDRHIYEYDEYRRHLISTKPLSLDLLGYDCPNVPIIEKLYQLMKNLYEKSKLYTHL